MTNLQIWVGTDFELVRKLKDECIRLFKDKTEFDRIQPKDRLNV